VAVVVVSEEAAFSVTAPATVAVPVPVTAIVGPLPPVSTKLAEKAPPPLGVKVPVNVVVPPAARLEDPKPLDTNWPALVPVEAATAILLTVDELLLVTVKVNEVPTLWHTVPKLVEVFAVMLSVGKVEKLLSVP